MAKTAVGAYFEYPRHGMQFTYKQCSALLYYDLFTSTRCALSIALFTTLYRACRHVHDGIPSDEAGAKFASPL